MSDRVSYDGQTTLTRAFGVLGAIAVVYALCFEVRTAIQTGEVYVGNVRYALGGKRFTEVYVPWQLAGPLLIELVFVFLCCVAMAVPSGRRLIGNIHPFIALLFGLISAPLIAPFCTSVIGNVAFLVFGSLVAALFLKLRLPKGFR